MALQELDSGCTAKTLQVRPHATVEEVCRVCADKFKVPDPENYGLFLLTEGSGQQLAPDTHPQKIKAELHSRSQATPFHFVFRRVAGGGVGASSSPSDLSPNLNDLAATSGPRADPNDLGAEPSGLGLPPGRLHGNSISIRPTEDGVAAGSESR